jgi:large repetitive protein
VLTLAAGGQGKATLRAFSLCDSSGNCPDAVNFQNTAKNLVRPVGVAQAANTGTVAPPGTLTFTTIAVSVVIQGKAYSTQLASFGGVGSTRTWSIINGTALPAGLSLNATTGVVSGSATTTGATTATSQVSDGSHMDTQNLLFQVNKLNITSVVAAPTTVKSGNSVTVTVTVANNGPATASGVATALSVTATGKSVATLQQAPSAVNIAGNQSSVFTYTYGVNNNGTLTFNATANGTYANAPAASVADSAGPIASNVVTVK